MHSTVIVNICELLWKYCNQIIVLLYQGPVVQTINSVIHRIVMFLNFLIVLSSASSISMLSFLFLPHLVDNAIPISYDCPQLVIITVLNIRLATNLGCPDSSVGRAAVEKPEDANPAWDNEFFVATYILRLIEI